MAIVEIPPILREKLTEEGTRALIKLLKDVEESAKGKSLEVVENRFERRLIEEVANLKSEFKNDIANLKTELKEDIANVKVSLLKWTIGLLVSQTAIILSILALFFK